MQSTKPSSRRWWTLGATAATACALAAGALTLPASAQSAAEQRGNQPDAPPSPAPGAAAAAAAAAKAADDKKPEFPTFDEVTKDYAKVNSNADGAPSLYTIYRRSKDNQLLAELPREFEKQRLFIALTVAAGEPTAGIQFGDYYANWKRYDKRLALIIPNTETRSSDKEFKASRDQLFTDRVLLDIPILTMGPGGGPVIDFDDLLLGQADKFFGPMARAINRNLATIAKAKAFPQNLEIAFQMPLAAEGGRLTTLHYSWSVLPESTGYNPRKADARVGYFTTSYNELADPSADETWTRYINRWKLEKADPSLKISPPKEPIVWYIEHTTPVRYRRWVREGIEMWNEAFEKIGIRNAIEVYQQDASTGAHMEKDPEDVRFNFLRWNVNQASFAIGPSRVDPRTGQILDADVVMNDGLIRWFGGWYRDLAAEASTEGFGPETFAWLAQRPQWDPRVRFAAPADQQRLIAQRAAAAASGAPGATGVPGALEAPCAAGTCSHDHQTGAGLLGAREYDGLAHRTSQVNGFCRLGEGVSMNIMLFRLAADAMGILQDDADGKGDKADDKKKDDKEKKDEKKKRDDLLDGVPEAFVGGFLRYVTCHEVGHCLGLRHNFKASTEFSLKELNSPDFGDKASFGSVMEYAGANINYKDGSVQGPFVTSRVGPYDLWAVEFGYGDDKTSKEALKRVAEPGLQYATDEDTWGPDPRARRWDLGADPLDFADSRLRLITHLRTKITDKIVKDGESWGKARRAYEVLLANHIGAVSIAANWVGGSFLNRDRKGDPAGRPPIENIPVETQRRALNIAIKSTFFDEAFGLTPDLLQRMAQDKWFDPGAINDIFRDETWDVHDRVMAVQAATLTMIMNPTKLRRVHDNEFRVPAGQDAVTLPEIINTVSDAIWQELDKGKSGSFTARQPMVSSLRRNLQREHVERLIDLTMPNGFLGAARKPVATLAAAKLREIAAKIDKVAGKDSAYPGIDPYTSAHLADARTRIAKALDAQYIYNTNDFGLGFGGGFFLGASPASKAE